MANAVNLTSDDFKDQISSGYTLVDFWAEWCGPCKIVGPIVEEIAGEMSDKLKVAKLDVDQYGEISQGYGVQGIPTMILFKDGEPVDRLVGAAPKATIMDFLNDKMGE